MSTSPAPSASDVMTVPVRHGMFCWFEHHSHAPERAVEYWTALVGGEHAAVPLPCGNTMHLLNAGQHHRWSLRALAGCPALLIERGPHWLPFVAVDDTDAAYARALEFGARSVAAPHDNGMGRGAIIEDPQGAALGLFTAASGATDGVNPHGHGFMCWCELVTPDPKASAAFLAYVLGWTSNDQDMGAFTVTIASANGHPVASLWTQCADDAHPWKRARWYPYVQVNAIDPAAAQAKALGATLPCDIMPIPGVGRWQPTYDPTGCETALLEPSHCAPKGS
jgi:predicted enzyme related to lactoylglutathione lyase